MSVAFIPQIAEARRPLIVDTGSESMANLVLVRFRVEGAFAEDIVEAIQTGAPTTFTYLFRLFQERPSLVDPRVFSMQIQRTIQYDTLRQEYEVGIDGERHVAHSLAEAERLMTDLEEIAVAVVSSLDPNYSYYVMVKAELAEVRLPFVFSFLRFLVAPFDFETRWARIDIALER